MADSRAGLPLLSVFMSEKKKKKKQRQARAPPPLPLPAVRDVIDQWALINAGSFIFSFAFSPAAYNMLNNYLCLCAPPVEPTWLPLCTEEMTDAEAAVGDAIALGLLWSTALQAAAGALALALPSHRRRLRLRLAYAALVATAAGHGMFAGLHRMFAATEPGGVFFFNTAAVFMFGAGDVLCFLGLVRRGGEE